MARYIDADKLITHLNDEIKGCAPKFGSRAGGKSIAYGTMLGLKMAISFAETLSTADVVPKSEVEKWKEINVQLHKEMSEQMTEERKIERKYVAREIFEEIEKVVGNKYEDYVFDNIEIEGVEQDAIIAFADEMKRTFAELKKKYSKKRKEKEEK